MTAPFNRPNVDGSKRQYNICISPTEKKNESKKSNFDTIEIFLKKIVQSPFKNVFTNDWSNNCNNYCSTPPGVEH